MKRMSKQEREYQQVEYAVNAILAKAEKYKCRTIGITSCLGLDREIEWLCQKCNARSEEGKRGIFARKLRSVSNYAEALEEARTCDAIVLAEKYTFTTYEMIEKMTQYLQRADIELLGVISIK